MSQPLAETIFWIAAAACALAELAILRFAFGPQPKKSDLVPSASRAGEIAWAVIPALALIVVFGATWQKIQARGAHHDMMDHPGMQHQMQLSSAAAAPGSAK